MNTVPEADLTKLKSDLGKLAKFEQMEQRALKIVNISLNTNIYSYLETSGGQSYNL